MATTNERDTLARFPKEIDRHVMIVLQDDGTRRHLRFRRPETMCMHFDLVTWPGHLCYTGDMGSFLFSRIEDMFEFFRSPGGRINPSYWAEKVLASDKSDGVTEFSREKFRAAVWRDVVEWIRENRDRTSRYERRELWRAVEDEFGDFDKGSAGKVYEFEHRLNARTAFRFVDFFEHSTSEYTHRFLWCLCAIVWGINTYDAAKVPQEAAAA
jgi:hypothetical protein